MNIKKKSPILWLQLASVLLILLLHIDSTHTQQQECCSGLKVSSNGLSTRFQSSRLGIYHQVGTLSSRPIYKNEQRNEYLFYLTTRSRGLWMIGPNPGSFNGGIANRADHPCIENIPTGSWKYADGSGWKKDSELSFECYSDVTECLYSDDSVLEGGDLYPNSVSFVSGTFECIRLCSSTPRCRYWSVDKLMNETRHVCTLKAWKGELIPKKGYVSGSLPKACHESAEPSTQITPSSNNRVSASDDNACVYRNLEFEGGDLRLLQNISSFSECRGKCSEYIECSLFSHHILRRECRLKSNQVSVRRNLRVSSGASIKTCKQVLSLKKRKQFFGRSKSEFKKYEDNEINGQFRITSEKWNPELENQESQSFQEMSSTIKDSLLEMIMEDSDIRDKAKFDITIVGFSPGSVICNFRINYILKEAYVAIPFIIKPKNVTNALLDKFKFQRGILFQRFVIASGSFKASSPVDHCDAMGCSHKCTYDYALQDYRCICPPGLYLDGDDKNCVEESLTTTTTPSNLPSDDSELPENCLLSPWTRWSRCSATCGPSTRSRARVVILPSKNGGSCDGDLREEKSCNLPACPGAENEVVEENNEDDIDDSEIVTRPTIDVSSKRVQNKEIENAESIDFEKLKELAPTIKSYVINKGIPYFYINNKMYYIPLGTTKVLQPLEKNSNIYTIQYTHPDGLQEQFELTNIESPAPTPTSFKLVDPKVISLPELIKNLDKVSNYYTITERVYFIINGIPNRIGEGRTDIVQDEVSGIPQIKYTYPEGRMSFIRLNQFASNADNSNEKVKNGPVNVNVGEFQKLLSDIEFYHLVDGAPYFMINGRPYAISPGKTEIVPSSESGVYIIRHFKPDNSVYEIKIKNDIPLPTVSQLPTIHNLSQNNPEIVDIYELEKLIPEVSGFYFIGSSPYFFVRGKPYKVEPGKIEIVYGPKGLPTQVKNILPDGTIYSIDLGSHSISPITTQTTVTPRLEDDSSSTSLPNQEDVSVLSQKVPEKITIQELEQLLPNISAYFEINSEPRFVIHNTPYVVSPGMTKVIPGDKSSSPTISYTYPNGTIYDIKLGGSSVSSGSPSGTYPTDSYESISIEELEKLIPQMSAYYIKDGTPYFVIYGKSYRIEPGKSEIIQDENSSGLTIKYTFPNATVYEIKLGSSEVGSTPSPLVPSILDEDKTKEITIEELEKSISDVSGYFIKNGVTYFVIDGEALVIKPGSTSISKGDDDSSLIIRHVYPNDTIYEVSIENSEASHTSVPHEIITNEPIGDNRVQSIGIKELEKLIPQITGYYILNGVPYFIINGKPHKVKDGNTEVLPEENGSSLIIRHIDQDNNTYEIYLGMKPKVEYQPSLDKGSPISTEKVTEDPSLEYGEPQIITFEELRNLLPKFSGYFVKEGVTFFIIAGKTYKVEPGLIEVIPDDKNSVIFVKYTHPDGNKSEIQLATHSADREPTSIAIKDFENLLANLSGYYVKNGAPYFVINEEPYTINGGVTEIISDQPNSPLTIRHTFPNGTIYDIEVGISSTELSSGSPHSPREEPVVITVDELKNLIPKVTGYYVQDGVTYFMINDKPHKVQPGKTNIKKSEEDGALIIQHENANGTLEEIKLSKEPDQVKEVTITELKDLIPKLTGYYNKNDVPYFIINDMTYIVKPGKTQVTQNDDGSSFVVKNISPEGLVTEINLGKPVQQQESPTTLENEKTPEISIDDLEKNIENVTGYYIRNGVPYFILNDNPYRITPGKTEIVENKDNSSTPLLIRHEKPDGSIKEIEIQRNPSDGSQTFEEVQPISFDDFEKNINEVTGYYSKNKEPYFIIGGKTHKITPGKTQYKQNEDTDTIKIEHQFPDGTKKEIVISAKSIIPQEKDSQFGTSIISGTESKSEKSTSTQSPKSDIQEDDSELDKTTTVQPIEEIVEGISIEELEKELPNIEKYITKNGIPYFFFNGVPKKVESGTTEIIQNNEDGTFSVKHVTPEGEIKEIKFSPKPFVFTQDSESSTPSSVETTSFQSEDTITVLPVDQVEKISFDDFEKEVPNVSEYYIKDGVPYFVISDKPTKIESGLTEVKPNSEDGSIKIIHTYPDGGVKEITLSAQPLQTTQGFSTTVSLGETTPSSDAVVTTTVSQDAVTTTLSEGLILEDDEIEDIPELISFDNLIKELPKISKYYIHRGIPYFVIKNKPHRVESGVTQVKPNDDGTLSIVNISPDGIVKEAQITTDQLKKDDAIDEERPEMISFEDLVKTLTKITRYYIKDGIPYFVINHKPYRVKSGETRVIPNKDGTVAITNISPDWTVREAKIPSGQLKEEEVVRIVRPTTITFENLVKELPKVNSYYIRMGIPYFIINNQPHRVESGVTQVTPNDDGTISIVNIRPDGSVKEAKVSSDRLTENTQTTTGSPIASESTTPNSVFTDEFRNEKVKEISFDDFEKEVPNVSEYYIKDGVPYFVINNKPTRIESGLTEVTPNSEDGSIKVTHTYPDGGVKEIILSAQTIQTTPSSDAVVTTTVSQDAVTTTLSEGLILEDDEIEDIPELISFDNLVKELPKISKYYIHRGIPYFVINNKPHRVESGVTQVKPNDDGTLSIVNISPDGSVKEAKVPSDQLTEETLTTTGSPNASEFTTPNSVYSNQVSTDQVQEISFEDFEKEVPNVSEYYITDGVPYFVINDKPTKIESGLTEVTPNNEDESIKVTHTYPDGGVKEIILSAQPIQTTQGISTTVSLGETTPSSDAVVTTTISQYTTTLSEGLISEDDKPELISFADLVKELPKVSQYYIHRGIPYFIINSKPHRVESGVTQVTPNDDGTLSIVNISPDGSVKEAKVSSDQLTEKPLTTTGSPIASESTTTFKTVDYVTTDKNGIITNEFENKTSDAKPTNQISFEELEEQLSNVTGYFVKDNVTHFVIDGKPMQIESGETSVVPNEEDGSLTITNVNPDGTVKAITLSAEPINEDSITTSPSSILISDTTKTPESIEEISTEQGVGETKTTPSSIETTMASGLIEEISTEQGVRETTTSHGIGGINMIPSIDSSVLNMSTPHTVISDITQKDAIPLSFKELKGLVPNITAYYVVEDIPYFVISDTPYFVNDGTTRLIPGDEHTPFTIRHTYPDGTLDEIALEKYDIVPGTVETGPNLEILTTESTPNESQDFPKPISINELEKLIPLVTSYYVLNNTPYFVIGSNVFYVVDGSTLISEGEEPNSLTIMHTFPNGTLYEIHLGDDRLSKKPINTTINELESLLYGITGYYVINGLPYFVVNGMTYYVDTGKTIIMPGDDNHPFTINHIFPNGSKYDIVLRDFSPNEKNIVDLSGSKFSTTPSTIDSNEGQIFSTTMKSDDGSRVTNTKETVEGFSTPSSNFHQSGDSNTSSPSSEIYEDEEKFEKGHSSTTPSTEDIQSTPGFGVSDLNSSTSPSLSETTDEDSSTNISITSTTSKTNVLEDESLTTFKSEDSEYISTSQPSVIDLITMTSSQVISDSTTTKKPIEDTTLDEEARPSLTSSTETISTTIINFISSTVKPLIKLGSNTEVPQKSTTEVPQLDISTTASVEENVFTVLPTGIISSNDSVIESSTEFASNEDKEHVFTVLPVDISSLTTESSDQFVDDGVKGSDKESTKELTSTTPSPVIDDASEDKKPSPIGGVSLTSNSVNSESTTSFSKQDYKTTKSPVFEDVSDAKISTSTVETRKEEEFSSTPAPSTITEKDTESEVVSEGSSNAFNDVSPGTLDDAQGTTTERPESEKVFTVLPTDISSIDKIAQSDDDTLDVNNEDSTTLAPEATTTYNAFEGNTKSSKEEESVFTVLPSKDLPSEYNPTTIIDLTTLVTTKAASSISSTERPEETVTTQSPTVVDLTTMKSTIISEDDTDVIIITTTVSPDITTTTTTTTTAAPSSMAQSTNDDEGTHTLNCQITAESCKTTDPTVPLNCKTGTSQPVTVLINKKDINLQEVIDKNLKIIVKEFMLMPMVMPTNGSSSKR